MTTLELPARVEPAFHWAPPYGFTLGDEVGQFCKGVGYGPDPEQQPILNDVFAEDANDDPAIFSNVVIGPRRNIKTGVEIQAALGWLFVLEVPSVHYSAHKWKTAEDTLDTIEQIIRNSDDLSRRMLPVRRGTGYGRLRTKTGQEMTFTTRTLDGGRGGETDKHVFDEALKLRPAHIAALLMTLATRPLAQIIYGSSACLADSDVLRELIERGRLGGDPSLSLTEFCAPRPHERISPDSDETVCDRGRDCDHQRGTLGCGMDKPKVLAIANPQRGRRIKVKFFEDARKEMPPLVFGREVLGWHDAPMKAGDEKPINIDRWTEVEDPYDEDDPDYVAPPTEFDKIGIDTDLDGQTTSFGAAERRADGRIHLEHVARGQGDDWAVARAIKLNHRHGPIVFALDGKGPAAHLIPKLAEAGLTVEVLSYDDAIEATRRVAVGVNQPDSIKYVHGPDAVLDGAVEAARKRPAGEKGFLIGRRKSAGDTTALTSVIFAAYVLEELDYDVSSSGY